MSTRPGDDASPKPERRLPKGPLIIILVVLATVAWVYWLTRSVPPRPAPELPPLRQLPLDSADPQESRPNPAEGQSSQQP